MIPAGVHQAFSNGPHRAREDLNTHKVIGMASHMLVAAKFVVGQHSESREHLQNKSKIVSFNQKEFRRANVWSSVHWRPSSIL